MVLENIPSLTKLVGRLGSSPGVGSVSTCPYSTIPARVRAAAESIMVAQLIHKLTKDLQEKGLEENFRKVFNFHKRHIYHTMIETCFKIPKSSEHEKFCSVFHHHSFF